MAALDVGDIVTTTDWLRLPGALDEGRQIAPGAAGVVTSVFEHWGWAVVAFNPGALPVYGTTTGPVLSVSLDQLERARELVAA
jgi:hypothetical protein